MKFEFFIAKRYLTAGKKSSFISIISLVSIVGIAIGVAALIVALSLINGFQNDIRNKILSSTAHIMINNIIGEGLEGYQDLIEIVKRDFKEVTSASPVVFGTVMIKGTAKNASGAVLRGVDVDSLKNENWKSKTSSGRLPVGKNEIFIGDEVSRRMSLFAGDTCFLIIPRPVLSPGGLIPKLKKMKISGIFHTGLYEVDNGTIISNLQTAQKLFNLENKINYLQIYIKNLFAADQVAGKMRDILPVHLAVITWQELNSSLYSALKLEKTVLFFTLTLIIVVASLNIIAGLILLVIQKIKDIGILLSYGATPKIIKKIFFIQGGIIGIVGTALGVFFGLIFCYLANKFELIKVPSEIYHMSHIPFKIAIFDLVAVILASILISFTATLIPSKKASSVNVVEAVKNE